jgi:hypothetical protein
MRDIENQIRKAVDSGEVIQYRVTPIYDGSRLIPIAITIEATGDKGTNIGISLLNRP